MSLTVQPIRFTDNIEEMARLLSTLGLSVSITSDKGGWVVLSGRAGTVALHSAADSATGARPGHTGLSFETSDPDGLARRLTAAGLGDGSHPGEAVVYDEAYGRAITIAMRDEKLTVNATSEDLYGYSSTGVRPGPDTGDLRVTPIRFVEDQTADRRLLEALGCTTVGEASEHFTQLALPDPGGAVGLHHVHTDELPVVPGPFAVQLSFQTATPLAEIVQRAESAGSVAELNESEFGDFVTLTDPDGQQIQVHAASM